MKNLNWFQARNLAKSEHRAIRREAWRKWLVFGPALRFISKVVAGVEQRYVVPNIEFGRDEFLANDWTDEPWVDGTIPSGVTPPSAGYQPGAGSGTGGGGGSGSFGPPSTGGGGSGGGGSGGGGDRHCPAGYHLSADGRKCEKDDGPDKSATVSVNIPQPDLSNLGSAFDSGKNCFPQSGTGGGSGSGPYSATVHVSVNIAGGPPGVGTLSVVLQGSTQVGTGWPGMNQDFEFTNVSFQPGSTISATATYNINGKTFTGSGSVGFPGMCARRGCMDPAANNYDPEAEEDDGSCNYTKRGCMDPTANNYDPEAEEDDGSCTYDDDDDDGGGGGSSNGSVGGSQM